MGDLSERLHEKKFFVNGVVPPFPQKNLLLDVTNYCNDKCVFCANSKVTRPRRFIEAVIVEKVLREARALGTSEVGFYAMGEPLLNKNIFRYIRQAKDLGFDYTYITTNGSLLNPDIWKKLLQAGLDSIKLSINAGSRKSYWEIHGRDDFDLVIENLKYISGFRKSHGIDIKIYVSFIVTAKTQSETAQLKEKISSYVDDIVYVPRYFPKECIRQVGLEASHLGESLGGSGLWVWAGAKKASGSNAA